MGVESQGVCNQRYSLIPRVLIFPVNENGEILLLEGARDKKIWAGYWNGLGGHVEQGESALSAAQRELLEESGLTAETMIYCGQVAVDTGQNPGIIFFVFKAKQLSGQVCDSKEGRLEWHSLQSALELKLVEDLYTLLPLVMRQRASGKPFWGRYHYDDQGQLVMSFRH
jgi:8-oxo-dGTP diphosphatase